VGPIKALRLNRPAVVALGVLTAISGIAGVGISPADAVPAPVVLSTTPITRPNSVIVGGARQAATSWGFTFSNTFAKGDALVLDVGPPGATACQSSTNYVGYAATPTVTVKAVSPGQDTPPSITATLAQQTSNPVEPLLCPGIHDRLLLAVGNGPDSTSPGSAGWTWGITISGISYDVGTATAPRNVTVGGSYVYGATGTTPVAVGISANAVVTAVGVTADNPPVLVHPNTTIDTSVTTTISPVVLTETSKGAIPSEFVCVELNAGNYFATSNTYAPVGMAKVNAGSGAVLSNSGALSGFGSPSAPGAFDTSGVAFRVATASTTAGAFQVTGLAVVDPDNVPSGSQNLTVFAASSVANCANGTAAAVYSYSVSAFSVFNTNRIYGQTADDTAAAELASVYPPSGTTCPPNGNVVLATDHNFPDALSASYMAKKLHTGVLLTPSGGLSSIAAAALRLEGITHVYVVGGPIAVGDNVVQQLQAAQAYSCGGTGGLTTGTGAPQDLTVTRVYGQTQYDTAQAVAQYFGAGAVGTGAFGGAYPTSVSGSSSYNTTTGLSGTVAPVSSAATPVAILATGQTFPDAMAASAMSYAEDWPILLTQQGSLAAQASAAISILGIKQVVVMGGPVAVSDTVVTQLVAMGVSVLRIAGADYTNTGQLLAQFELSTTADGSSRATGLDWADLGANPNTYGVNVARGDFYADALAGSAVGGTNHSPIVLTLNPSTLGSGIPDLFNTEAGLTTPNHVDAVTILGGPMAVTPATEAAVLQAIGNS